MSPPLSPDFPLRVGVDVVEVDRFARALTRHGERLLARLFTPAERALTRERPERLAARFAAKEAVAKALGTGIGPVAWRDIEILATPQGEPVLHLHRAAARCARDRGLSHWALSLSHTRHTAVAFVMAWGDAPGKDAPCA